MDKGGILKFSFPDMALYLDGELVSAGSIDSIYVPYLTDFKTSMSYYLVPNLSLYICHRQRVRCAR